jgi:hypothetical protein
MHQLHYRKIQSALLGIVRKWNSDNKPQKFDCPNSTNRNWHYAGMPSLHAKQAHNDFRKNVYEMVIMNVQGRTNESMQLA